MAALTCPYCSGTEWLAGPQGGLSQNIMCANSECEHWFNHSPFGLDDLHEVGAKRISVDRPASHDAAHSQATGSQE